MTEKLLVTAREAADLLSISTNEVYALASAGVLEKRWIGKGTREFRIPYQSIKAYAEGLPTERTAS